MANVYDTSTFKESIPGLGVKEIVCITPATADATDTLVINLGSYGIGTLLGLTEYIHTTTESVIIPADNAEVGVADVGGVGKLSTTSVTDGVLTITLGTGTDKMHVFRILGMT